MRCVLAAAVAILLNACSPPPVAVTAPLDGRSIYLSKCSACHMPDGSGIPGICPPLPSSPRIRDGRTDDMIRILLLGMKGKVERQGQAYIGIMPAWRFDLDDSSIAAVINDMSSRWSPGNPQVKPEDVARIRAITERERLFPPPDDPGFVR